MYARPPSMGPIPMPKDDRGVPLVWRLKRPLYGEADAARIWYFTLHKQLLAQKFIRSEYDPCLYRKVYPDGARIDLSIYVDDSWMVDTAGARADAELAELQKHFTLTVTEDPKFFLGMNYARGRNGAVQFNSYAYVQKLVGKYLPKQLDSYRVRPSRRPHAAPCLRRGSQAQVRERRDRSRAQDTLHVYNWRAYLLFAKRAP